MPRRPTSAAVSGSPVADHMRGYGCCHGRGQMFTWRWVKYLPSQLNGPSWWLSAFLMRSIASQYRSTFPTGLALADAISVPPDLTKPISRRPREMTSAVAYSSATRTGSDRSEIRVPRLRMRTLRVWRARMPTSMGLAPSRELIPAWCSIASTLRPRSSHSRNSSITSSNRSAETLGSQYLFGRLALTESAASSTSWGTNGYGTSHCHQASIVSLSRRIEGSAIQEARDVLGKGFGLLDLRVVAGALDEHEARAGNQGAVGLTVRGLDDPVARAPEHERRHRDAAEPALELGIVHVRLPAVEGQRVPVPGANDQLVVRQRVVVRRPFRRVVPAPPLHLLRRRVEDVQDVRRLAIADLETERVHEDETVDAMAALHRDFRGEPAPEGQPHHRDFLVGQRLEDVEIEVHEIVHGLEIPGALRVAESGMRRGDDLGAPAEQIEKRRPRVDALHAVQEQHRPAGAPAHHLQLDASDRHPLRRPGRVRHADILVPDLDPGQRREPRRREPEHLLVLLVQHVLEAGLPDDLPQPDHVLEQDVGEREVELLVARQVHPGAPRFVEVTVDGGALDEETRDRAEAVARIADRDAPRMRGPAEQGLALGASV